MGGPRKKVEENFNEESWREAYEETFAKLNPKQARFFLFFLNTGSMSHSYQKAFGRPDMPSNQAAMMAGRILKKINFDLVTFLEFMGHNDTKLSSALDTLYNKDPDKYLSHIEKIRQLDNRKLELSGSISIPVINIVTSKEE